MGDSGEQGKAADTASISPDPQLLNCIEEEKY